MTKDNEVTPVIFKLEGKGAVVAFFPTLPGTGPHDVTCYSHFGQHASATLEYLATRKPASPEEYAALKRELESAPFNYNLRVIRRTNPAHTEARRKACVRS